MTATPRRWHDGGMLTLYHTAHTSAFRCRWTLEETGLPHTIVEIDLATGEHKRPEYLKIHPLGSVPALVDGDAVVIESAAICMHLAERDPERRLVPSEGTAARGHYYQWILYGMTNLDEAIHGPYLRTLREPPERKAEVANEAERAALHRRLAPLAGPLSRGPFVLGERFSTADIVLGGLLLWAETCGQLRGAQVAEAYLARLRARPAFQRALAG